MNVDRARHRVQAGCVEVAASRPEAALVGDLGDAAPLDPDVGDATPASVTTVALRIRRSYTRQLLTVTGRRVKCQFRLERPYESSVDPDERAGSGTSPARSRGTRPRRPARAGRRSGRLGSRLGLAAHILDRQARRRGARLVERSTRGVASRPGTTPLIVTPSAATAALAVFSQAASAERPAFE